METCNYIETILIFDMEICQILQIVERKKTLLVSCFCVHNTQANPSEELPQNYKPTVFRFGW